MPIPQPAVPAPQDRPRQRVDAIGNKALRLRQRPARQWFPAPSGCTGQGSQRGHTPPGPPRPPTVRGPPPGGGHPPPGAAALIGLEQGRAEQVAHLGGGESDLTDTGHRSTADRPLSSSMMPGGPAVPSRCAAVPRGSNPRAEPTDTGHSNQRPPVLVAHPGQGPSETSPPAPSFAGTRPPGHRGADRSPTPRTIA
jgi:hypothetical protein